MLHRLVTLYDRVRSSLFFLPMVFILAGVLLGEGMLLLDATVDGLPARLTATVDSARSVLGTVAGATLAFAGIAFSVSLLLISLASSQFSPRVVHGLFRDPFNKRVMGFVIGTFTYCLVVLRAVREPLDNGDEGIVPSISILLAVVLGVASVLAIVAFINHSAHSMDVSKILHRVTEEALTSAKSVWHDEGRPGRARHATTRNDEAVTIRLDAHGWVQRVEHERILAAMPAGSTFHLDTRAGRYVVEGSSLGALWPCPDAVDDVTSRLRSAVLVGETRTMQQDVSYGVRQLADVALKAMSPGVNDPTTAQDAMFHLGTVLTALLRRVPPEQTMRGDEGRVLELGQGVTHRELVGLAFDEVRLASADQPTASVYLLKVIAMVRDALGDLDRAEAMAALAEQEALILAMSERSELPDPDRARVRDAASRVLPA